jgi:chitodextrinase
LLIGAAGSIGGPLEEDIENENIRSTSDILFSDINIKVKEKLLNDDGGYSIFYYLFSFGNHEVTCNVDYEVWHGGNFDYGVHDVGNTFSLGIITISYGFTRVYWDNFDIGSFQASLIFDGEVVASDYDEDNDDNGEFEVDAKGDYESRIGEFIQIEGYAKGGVEPYSWHWDFGDGETATEQFPQHQYLAEGVYQVILTVTDAEGNVSTDETRSKIENDFEADAGGDYEGLVGESIQFNGKAEHGIEPYTWLWDFGNGDTSTEEDPIYAYSAAGDFTVILTVTDDVGNTASDQTMAYITSE